MKQTTAETGTLHVIIPLKVRLAIKAEAAITGQSIPEFVVTLWEHYVKSKKKGRAAA